MPNCGWDHPLSREHSEDSGQAVYPDAGGGEDSDAGAQSDNEFAPNEAPFGESVRESSNLHIGGYVAEQIEGVQHHKGSRPEHHTRPTSPSQNQYLCCQTEESHDYHYDIACNCEYLLLPLAAIQLFIGRVPTSTHSGGVSRYLSDKRRVTHMRR